MNRIRQCVGWGCLLAVVAVACGAPTNTLDAGTTGGGSGFGGSMGGAAGGGAGAAGGGGGGPVGFPCAVASVISENCLSCHGSPLHSGAPNQLITRADFAATSSAGKSYAQQCLARMNDPVAPMPPSGGLTPTDRSTYADWLDAGLPGGACLTTESTGAGGGTGGGAGAGGGSAVGGGVGTGGGSGTGGGAAVGGGTGTGGGSATGGGTAVGGGTGTGGGSADAGPTPASYTTNCARCHGAHGEGVSGPDGGPRIEHVNETLAQFFVRNGEDNIFIDVATAGPQLQLYIGDPRTMPAFSTTQVSAANLTAIDTWLRAMPRPTTGPGLFDLYCSRCHGPSVPNNSNNGHDARGAHYVKPGVDFANLTWTNFRNTVRNGLNVTLSPAVDRRRYMPPFPVSQISDAEIALIAHWICGQYPASVTIPSNSYCNTAP